MIVVKKWLLLGGLGVVLLFNGWQMVYASEDATSNASIVFYDTAPTPNPPTNGNEQTVNAPIKKPSINQTLPKTNEKNDQWLFSIIGIELVVLAWLLFWKRRKEGEEDEQKDARRS